MKGTFLKKSIAVLLGACTLACACSFAACDDWGGGGVDTDYQVYVPDGAPALSMAMMMHDDTDTDGFDYHVVGANEITLKVTGNTDLADFAILPVSDASNHLGTGDVYQMLGSVTQGNLYLCSSTENTWIDGSNVEQELVGKTVGVVQYQRFPGLAFRATLKKLGLNYHVISEDTPYKMQTMVNIKAINADQVGDASTGVDYYLAFEPNLTRVLSNEQKNLSLVSNVQMLYGGGGYPQAVLVAKTSLINEKPEMVRAFMDKMDLADDWVLTASAETLYNTIQNHANDFNVMFTASDLSVHTLNRCSIRFQRTASCKTKVETFLTELKGVNATVRLTTDNFFAIL